MPRWQLKIALSGQMSASISTVWAARTLQVKSQEAILATGLTQQYPKWKIMEMYLNTVYYGDLDYGVEAAAQDLFNLQPKCTATHCVPAVSQLDLAQASMLAGLPQSPSY